MQELSDEQSEQIVEFLSQGKLGDATRIHRKFTGVSINAAIEAISEWQKEVPVASPEDLNEKAFQQLASVPRPILVIEAIWDADVWSFMIQLSAITEGASEQNPRFTPHELCLMTASKWDKTQTPESQDLEKSLAYAATQLGTRLAESVNADFCLVSETIDFDKRWWDDKPSESAL